MPYVKQNPDLIKRMIDEGHIVGNHTVNHPSMPEVTDDAKLVNERLRTINGEKVAWATMDENLVI
jgi:peptidoglycan/xylan/chitin deacetylase (PgdA/CDA1 family)